MAHLLKPFNVHQNTKDSDSILSILPVAQQSWRFEFDEYAILQRSLPNLESFYFQWKEKFGVCKFTKYCNTGDRRRLPGMKVENIEML